MPAPHGRSGGRLPGRADSIEMLFQRAPPLGVELVVGAGGETHGSCIASRLALVRGRGVAPAGRTSTSRRVSGGYRARDRQQLFAYAGGSARLFERCERCERFSDRFLVLRRDAQHPAVGPHGRLGASRGQLIRAKTFRAPGGSL